HERLSGYGVQRWVGHLVVKPGSVARTIGPQITDDRLEGGRILEHSRSAVCHRRTQRTVLKNAQITNAEHFDFFLAGITCQGAANQRPPREAVQDSDVSASDRKYRRSFDASSEDGQCRRREYQRRPIQAAREEREVCVL